MPQTLRPEVTLARQFRKEMSFPEVLLRQRPRGRSTGQKFRRQHPIGPYVADFCCVALRLVIEIDGEVHAGRVDADVARDSFLRENGYFVLRVRAADILEDVDAVAASIAVLAARPLHRAAGGPPPRTGEDQE